jgi:hypothetical protein
MQQMLGELTRYNNSNSNDGSSSNNRLRLDAKTIYDRRQSMAPIQGGYAHTKLMSMHSKILDTTENS